MTSRNCKCIASSSPAVLDTPNRPFQTLQSILQQIAIGGYHVRLTNSKTDRKEETGIPVDENEDEENNFGNSKCVWPCSSCLGFLEIFEHSVDSEDSVESDDDRARDSLVAFRLEKEVNEIGRQNADYVKLEEF